MNASPFWPLMWKEYRAGRAFWLAMVAIALMVQGSVCWLGKPPERNLGLYAIALAIAAGLMTGAGATMFAVEREEQTFGFVRRLPVRPWQLALPKLLCALAGWGAFVTLLWLAAGAMAAWQFPSARDAGQLWTHWSVACLECLAWGIFFSLLLSSPLKAAALSMLAVGAVNFLPIVHSRITYSGIAAHVAVVPQRLVLLALVAAIDAWLLPRWLTDSIPRPSLGWRPNLGGLRAKRAACWNHPGPSWWTPLTHLMWQSWRELVGNWLALGLIILGTLTGSTYEFLNAAANLPLFADSQSFWFLLILPMLPVAIYGSLVFHADQMRGPQFFAQHGVSARLVWISRQIVWIGSLFAIRFAIVGLVLVCAFLIQPLRDLLGSGSPAPPIAIRPFGAFSPVIFMMSVYALGQMASLFVRRSLLAGLKAAVLGVLLLFWTRLLWALGIAWWWTLLPIMAGSFAATWLRTPDWLLERPDWRGWIGPVAAIALPTLFVLTAVPCFRAYQVPWVKPVHWNAPLPIKPGDPPDVIAQGKAKRELYDKAWAVDYMRREALLPQLADLVLAASRLDGPLWAADWSDAREAAQRIDVMAKQMIEFAHVETKQGNLDAALEIYFGAMRAEIDAARLGGLQAPHAWRSDLPGSLAFGPLIEWAAAPGQTVSRIHDAVAELRHFRSTIPPMEILVAPSYGIAPLRVAEQFEKEEILDWMPWEYARTMRLVHLLTIEQLMNVIQIDSALEVGRPIGRFVPERADPAILTPTEAARLMARNVQLASGRTSVRPEDAAFPTRDRIVELVRTTPLISASGIAGAEPIEMVVTLETDYRATLIILALEAWKLQHGQLPSALNDLLERELPAVPVVPQSGQPFGYYPDGMPLIAAQRLPFLWSEQGNSATKKHRDDSWQRRQGLLQGYLIP